MFPENTLPAFEYAIAAGVDALEMDVAVTRDDVVVVSHDPKLNRVIWRSPDRRSRVIRELTLAEVRRWDFGTRRHPRFPRQTPVPGARIPTLEEVLALAGRGDFLFNIEVKSYPRRPKLAPPPERFAELIWQVVRRHRLEKRVMVQSFDFRILPAMRRLAPAVRLAALYAGRPRSFAAIARQAGVDMVAAHRALVSPKRVQAAHAAGLQVVAWTANSRREWKRLAAAQVDAIITDNPGALLAYLRENGLRP